MECGGAVIFRVQLASRAYSLDRQKGEQSRLGWTHYAARDSADNGETRAIVHLSMEAHGRGDGSHARPGPRSRAAHVSALDCLCLAPLQQRTPVNARVRVSRQEAGTAISRVYPGGSRRHSKVETCPPTVVSQVITIAELCDVQKLLPHPARSTQPLTRTRRLPSELWAAVSRCAPRCPAPPRVTPLPPLATRPLHSQRMQTHRYHARPRRPYNSEPQVSVLHGVSVARPAPAPTRSISANHNRSRANGIWNATENAELGDDMTDVSVACL